MTSDKPRVTEVSDFQVVIPLHLLKHLMDSVPNPSLSRNANYLLSYQFTLAKCKVQKIVDAQINDPSTEHDKKAFRVLLPKGTKCPAQTRTLEEAWARDQEVICDLTREISRLKEKINKLNQQLTKEKTIPPI